MSFAILTTQAAWSGFWQWSQTQLGATIVGGLVVAAVLGAVGWLARRRRLRKAAATNRIDESSDDLSTTHPANPTFQWRLAKEGDETVRLINEGALAEVTTIVGRPGLTRVSTDFSLPVRVPHKSSIELRVRKDNGHERHWLKVNWLREGRGNLQSHSFDV